MPIFMSLVVITIPTDDFINNALYLRPDASIIKFLSVK